MQLALAQSEGIDEDLLEKRTRSEEVKLGSLVESIVKHEELKMGHGLEIQNEVPREAKLKGDPVSMGRAIGNVVRNACEASGPNSKLLLKLEKGRSGDLFLRVRNSGNFLSAEKIQKILKGHREPNKTRSHGIGVLSAKEQMKRLGGGFRMWSRNAPEKSDSFVEVVLRFPSNASF